MRPTLAPLLVLAACGGPEPLAVWQADPNGQATESGSVAVLAVPNLDDDDGSGTPDWEQLGEAEGDDDRAHVRLTNRGRDTLLRFSGPNEGVRVYHQGRLVMGDGYVDEWMLPDRKRSEAIDIAIEVGNFGLLNTLELVDAKREVTAELPIVGSAPAIAHHLLPTERAWVLAVDEVGWRNTDMLAALQGGLGDLLDVLPPEPYGYDVWVQDEPEFTRAWSPESQSTLVLNSIRDGNGMGGLAPFPATLVEPDVYERTIGEGEANTYDAFGNLEASPPVQVDGVNYPLGRIYYGWDGQDGGEGPVAALRDYLDSLEHQRPFWIDTSWLCVGHIDEVTSFVPDPTAPRGFRFLMADTDLGWQALNAVPANTPLDRHGRTGERGHGRRTAGAYTSDPALRAYNQDIQRDALDPTLQVFRDEIGLLDEEIVRVPAYFEEIADRGWVCGAAAVIPGMVNLLMETDASGEGGRAWIADPFFRPPNTPHGDDPFIAMWNDLLPATIEPVYIDNWEVYHMGLGEVHCATNQERAPALSRVSDLNAWLDEVTR